MRKHLRLLAAAAVVAASSLAARADTIDTFSLSNATFQSGATATGTLVVDTTTGVATGLNVTYQHGTIVYDFLLIDLQREYSAGNLYQIVALDGAGHEFNMEVEGTSLVGYAGGNLCSLDNGYGCAAAEGGGFYASGVDTVRVGDNDVLQSGALVLPSTETTGTSVTPEPSTLALFGSGALGLIGTMRRRLLA